jgi:MraZ protein
MLTRKTQYGWMALGGLLCLFGVVLTCKLQEGNRALAGDESPPAAAEKKPADPAAKDKGEEKGAETKKADETPKPSEKPAPLGVTMPMPEAPPAPPVSGPDRSSPPAPPSPPPADGSPTPAEGGAGSKPVAGSAGGPPPNAPPAPSAVVATGPASEKKDEAPVGPPPMGAPPAASAVGTPPAEAGSTSTGLPPASPSATVPPMSAGGATGAVPPPDVTAVTPPPPPKEEAHPMPGEPPLAPAPGPVQTYQVRSPETLRDLARHTMGNSDRWADIYKLNPNLKPEATLAAGTVVRLPGDACVQPDDGEPVKPLPALRPKAPAKAKVVLPLTGTFPCNLDDKKAMTLPRAIRDQLGGTDTVLISPGPDRCLWLTNQAHLERLAQRLEQSPAREVDVRVFKRLYFAQTEKTALTADGRVAISERLAQFAGLHQEVVLVGIDDHFELWDAARWRQYTQQKSAAAKAAQADHD